MSLECYSKRAQIEAMKHVLWRMGDVVGAFPTVVDEPRVWLSSTQGEVCAKLPGWVRLSLVAGALELGTAGMEKALEFTEDELWVWATEFENVHDVWRFAEPRLTIDGQEYKDSEAYYRVHKPAGKDRSAAANAQRVAVMRRGVAAKFVASGEARTEEAQSDVRCHRRSLMNWWRREVKRPSRGGSGAGVLEQENMTGEQMIMGR